MLSFIIIHAAKYAQIKMALIYIQYLSMRILSWVSNFISKSKALIITWSQCLRQWLYIYHDMYIYHASTVWYIWCTYICIYGELPKNEILVTWWVKLCLHVTCNNRRRCLVAQMVSYKQFYKQHIYKY